MREAFATLVSASGRRARSAPLRFTTRAQSRALRKPYEEVTWETHTYLSRITSFYHMDQKLIECGRGFVGGARRNRFESKNRGAHSTYCCRPTYSRCVCIRHRRCVSLMTTNINAASTNPRFESDDARWSAARQRNRELIGFSSELLFLRRPRG